MASRPVTTVWRSPLSAAPNIGRISRQLVRAFAWFVVQPAGWYSVDEISRASGVPKRTIYNRFANLTEARVVAERRANDVRVYHLRPDWKASPAGRELAQRVTAKLLGPHGGNPSG